MQWQLQAPAAYITEVRSEQAQTRLLIDRGPSFFNFLFVDENFSGEYQGLGALSRRRQSTLYQQLIKTNLHRREFKFGESIPQAPWIVQNVEAMR